MSVTEGLTAFICQLIVIITLDCIESNYGSVFSSGAGRITITSATNIHLPLRTDRK